MSDNTEEAVHRENFRKFWADLGPKMAFKELGRDMEAEEIFMLGWAIGVQEGMIVGLNEAVALSHKIRAGG